MVTKGHSNAFFGFHLCLRIFTIATTAAASYLILTSKESTLVYGLKFDARYSYSSAYKFFAFANCAAAGFSVIATLIALVLKSAEKFFVMFLHDLVMVTGLMAGCAAATAVGFIGKYGNKHTGWMQICDKFTKYCDRVTKSVGCSFIAVFLYLILTIVSANGSRKIQQTT